MNIETVIKKTFNFHLSNNAGSFKLDENEVRNITLFKDALTVSDSNNSYKKYLIVRKEALEGWWLWSKIRIFFNNVDSIKDLEDIIKDFAETFGSDFSKDFNDLLIKEMFNFDSDDENVRSKANNRMKNYFDLNFIEEFTFGYRDVNYKLFVFEECQW